MNKQQNTKDGLDVELATSAFEHFPASISSTLQEIRSLIIDVKDNDATIGELSEVLRWGQLSYLTTSPKTGSMIRLGLSKCEKPAMFFHCGTTLVDTFRTQYSHLFEFEGNRAMVIQESVDACEVELRDCITQALTYHLKN